MFCIHGFFLCILTFTLVFHSTLTDSIFTDMYHLSQNLRFTPISEMLKCEDMYSWSSLFADSVFANSPAYLPKFICNYKINTWVLWKSFVDMYSMMKILNHCAYSQLMLNKVTLPSCFSFHTIVLFMVYLMPQFLHFCAFFYWFHCLIWLLSVVKCFPVHLSARRLICLAEKMHIT